MKYLLFKDMKRSTGIFLVMFLILVVGATIVKVANKKQNTYENNIIGSGGYCNSEGVLTQEKPIQSHRSYCVKSNADSRTYSPNTPLEYLFSIVDDQGKILKDFAVTHTKTMHLIVVRKDLKYFQHVHPELNQNTGLFTLDNLTLPANGQYRIFADFVPSGSQTGPDGMPLGTTLSQDIVVGDDYKPEAIGTEEKTKTFDGYQVTLKTSTNPLVSGKESSLTFNLQQNDQPIVDLQEYLGALGHSVILREGTLDFVHAHPDRDPTIEQHGNVHFTVDFPQSGKYKVFSQFQRQGKVLTTDFVVSVKQGANPSNTMDMPDMD